MQLPGDAIALVKTALEPTDKLDPKVKILGTSFCFLKPNWFVTAKHVVINDETGEQRFPIILSTADPENLGKSKITFPKAVFTHETFDIALLECHTDLCSKPMMPAHHDFVGGKGFFKLGYNPKKNVIEVIHVKEYEIERRVRDIGTETIIVFDDNEATGGNSGGPICGDLGGVVGVTIEGANETASCRATTVDVLLKWLSIEPGQTGMSRPAAFEIPIGLSKALSRSSE